MDDDARERDRLRRGVRSSRALFQAGRIAAAIGWIWLGALAVSLLVFTPSAMVASLALGIGGLVLAGSSKTTTLELEAELSALEADASAERGDKVVSLFGSGAHSRRARPRL